MGVARWLEEDVYLKIRNIKDIITYPIIRVLAGMGVHPDLLTYLGVLSMLGFIYFVDHDPLSACACLAATLVMDSLDGALARYLHIDSDRGKFVDIFADNLNFTLFVIGLLYASLIDGVTAVLFTYFMLLTRVLLIFRKNVGQKSDWIIRPAAGTVIVLSIGPSYFLFLVYALTGINYLEIGALFFTVLLIVQTIMEYYTIRFTPFLKLKKDRHSQN